MEAANQHPGVKQRRAIRMSEAEVDEFLAGRHSLAMSTLNHDGSIHSVAMWYGFLDGRLAVQTKLKSQKAQNLTRDPRITCLVEAGDTYDDLRGVELVGRAELIEDPAQLLQVSTSVYERYTGTYTEDVKDFLERSIRKRVAIVLNVDRVVSWDHRKLLVNSSTS
jgi:PPOX class probable F420-dependent enzyme